MQLLNITPLQAGHASTSIRTWWLSVLTVLIPSNRLNTVFHRHIALSALRASYSLSVRLKRYNAHMDIARTLVAQGNPQ